MIPDIARKCKEGLTRRQNSLGNLVLATLALFLILGLAKLSWLMEQRAPIRLVETGAAIGTTRTSAQESQEPTPPATTGKYVGSKSGTRYYLPTCSGVSRIKEENRVWFATKEEAESRGLLPATNCKGM